MVVYWKMTLAFSLFFLLQVNTNSASAQTKFHYVPAVNVNFYEAGNWFCDFPATTSCTPTWLTGTHNFTIPASDTIVIHGFCTLIDVTTLTNNGVIELVDGTLSMSELSFVHNNGVIDFDVNSIGDNGEGGDFNLNNGSTFILNGQLSISNFGNLNINTGSTLTIGPSGLLSFY